MSGDMRAMTVGDFCYNHTKVGELVIIRDQGYTVASVYIDYEDLYIMHPSIGKRKVMQSEWGKIEITDKDGNQVATPVHYVDVD